MFASEMGKDYIQLLKKLISLPSLSREENKTAELIRGFLTERGVTCRQQNNNIWCKNKFFKPELPTILLNSHHDTVKPAANWQRDPYDPVEEDGKIFGLGSNDAGGALVSLLFTFLHFHDRQDLTFNLIFAATAEEEISGSDGIESILPDLGEIAAGIVGEPTQMHLAIAEKGLMVLDCLVKGKSGHAARNEGVNAIYKAMDDIEWFRTYRFTKTSDLLGEVKMNVTQIEAGYQHNVVPDQCKLVVDVRTNEHYANREIFDIVESSVGAEVKARSFRLNSSGIALDHPLVMRGMDLGLRCFGSPTLSDQALMPFPTLKVGPGDSARSHTADEYIYVEEISQGIQLYIKILEGLNL